MSAVFERYSSSLVSMLASEGINQVPDLCQDLLTCWNSRKGVFICGNGGSGANAVHLANDYLFGADKKNGIGLRVEALPSNSAIMTCLANDIGYEKVFSHQLRVKADKDDLLIVLSGSGNSPNIIEALKTAKDLGVKSWAVLGFDGGLAKTLADRVIHFPINDMQVSEDLQMIVGHMCMQWLSIERSSNE